LKVAAEVSAKTKWPLTTLIITDDAKTAADLSAKVEDAVEPYGVDNALVVLEGRADREIMNFIKEGAVELMVMGAHSRAASGSYSWEARQPTSSAAVRYLP